MQQAKTAADTVKSGVKKAAESGKSEAKKGTEVVKSEVKKSAGKAAEKLPRAKRALKHLVSEIDAQAAGGTLLLIKLGFHLDSRNLYPKWRP